ncbi:hypothetical protein [Mesorhizobium sp. CN2-181]|uniref:hypothetical protein n=1 Tax=Mesorhizobium yinganensis TaxID=3157707 RepID=UPI0032B77DEB
MNAIPVTTPVQVAIAVRHVRLARNALHAAVLHLDDAGYDCATLNSLYSGASGLIATWAGRPPPPDNIPENIARSAAEWRRAHRRTY